MSDSTIAFDKTIRLMQDRLSLNSFNQKVISSNLANINTPGYVAKESTFDEVLRESMEGERFPMARSSSQHLDPFEPQQAMESPQVTETGPVSLDYEMMKLSKNSVEYQYIVSMLNKKFAMLKEAIGEGAL